MPLWTDPVVGQWFVSADGVRWWFDSGDIALDFAYAGSMGGRPEWERWHTPEDMERWMAERFGVRVIATAADLRRAKRLRDAIAGLVTDVSRGQPQRLEQQAIVNQYAAQPDLAPQLGWDRPRPKVGQLLATLARAAVHLLSEHVDRIRECGAADCAVVYVDTSRSGNRRWCSMSRCGNRHKVREHRARHASSRTDTRSNKRPDTRSDPRSPTTGEPE